MKLKLIDVQVEDGEEVELGTCDLCFRTELVNNPTFIFQDNQGKEYEIAAYYWDVDNYDGIYVDEIKFAEWISKKEFSDGTEIDENWLWDIVGKYYEEVD